jgi:membrane fusion protein, multidrug efflux system
MAADSTPAPATGPQQKPEPGQSSARSKVNLRKYGTPALVVVLAVVILATITWNWNSWEGGRTEQVTDDAYVRGDITPLSTKGAGLVKEVMVSDYQSVHKGDLLVQLDDDDFNAQVAQASAAVEAAKAAIEDNRRQRDLEDARIDRALAGVDQANAQIAAAQAGKEAVQADVVRAGLERKRQEALIQTGSTTQRTVEQAVADDGRFSSQLASRDADLVQAKTMLRSNELAVEAERRTKSVVESQEAQLTADLHAKEAALVVAKVNLGYTRITAPEDGTVGERQVRPGQLVSPGTQVISFVSRIRGVVANYRETQLTNMKIWDPT